MAYGIKFLFYSGHSAEFFLVKFRFSMKATKMWCNFTQGLNMTKQLPNLEDDCTKFFGLLRIYQLYLLWPFVQQKLGQIYRRYIPIGFCRISAGSISLDSLRTLFLFYPTLQAFFSSFFSTEQWKFLEKMVLVFNVKKYLQQEK